MTTDVEIVSASDLFVLNEVFNVGDVVTDKSLSVAKFSVVGSSSYSVSVVLNFVYGLIENKYPEHDLWVLLGSSAWQPDTRIVRHRKLSGALKSRGLEIAGGSDWQEHAIEAEGKIRFFGGLCFSELSINTVADVLEKERCSYIVALPKSFDVMSLLNRGWLGELKGDLDFLDAISKRGGLAFKKVGAYDDGERGFLFVGLPDVMENLLR
jgi:hypothetical protein